MKRYSASLIINSNQNFWAGHKVCSDIISHWLEWTSSKKPTNNKCWRGCEEKGSLLQCWWECKLVPPLWRTTWWFLNKLKMELTYDLAIPLLGMYPVCAHPKSLQYCPTLCNPLDHNLPGSCVHGILQARILVWAAMPSFRDLPDPGIETASLKSPAFQACP